MSLPEAVTVVDVAVDVPSAESVMDWLHTAYVLPRREQLSVYDPEAPLVEVA